MRTHKTQVVHALPKVPDLPDRIPSLDGLRAVSILCVVIGHSSLSPHAPTALRYFDHLGNFGVRCFFIISGLLITTLLVKEKERTGAISLKGFYWRRALRIFPASLTYIAVIAVLAATGLITLKRYDLLHAVTYTMNYHAVRAVWLDHLWSLSVEEQFYLLWPGILILCGLSRSAKIAWIVVLVTPAVRTVMWFFVGASETAMTKHFEANADALATGCILAMFHGWLVSRPRYLKLLRSVLFWPLTLGLIATGNLVFLASPAAFYVIGQTLANVGTALAIHWAVLNARTATGKILNSRPAAYVGVLSYSLYLWQNFFLNNEWSLWPGWFPFNILFSFALAMLSYHAIEKPFLKLKAKRSAPPAYTAVAAGAGS